MRILFDTVPETRLSLRLYPFDEDPARFVEVALLAYPAGGQTYWLPPQVRPCRMALRCSDEAEAIEQAMSKAALIAGQLYLATDPEGAFAAMQRQGTASPGAPGSPREAKRPLREKDASGEGGSTPASS